MKLAYFSPLPPARTGVATYSNSLLPALARLHDVAVFTPTHTDVVVGGSPAVDFVSNPRSLKVLPHFDAVVYHVGNNPWFHADIHKAFLGSPGPVVLHDTVLYFLIAGAGKGALLRELLLSQGAEGLVAYRDIVASSPSGDLLRYAAPSRYPCLTRILALAPSILVHNRAAEHALRQLGYERDICVIPMLFDWRSARAQPGDVREQYGLRSEHVVFGTFGFIGATKRLDKVCAAFARLARRKENYNARLLIVGEGMPILPIVREYGIESLAVVVGYAPDEDFRRLLQTSDVVLNLRYPAHGESSLSLLQAMACGKPCVVTDDAFFAELPDASVIKVGYGEGEIDELQSVMQNLIADVGLRRRIGAAARDHAERHHSPEVVAAAYSEALQRWHVPKERDEGPGLKPDSGIEPTLVGDYWTSRVIGAIP